MKHKKVQEKVIIFKVKTKRDPDSFGEFYDLYVERIYRFIYFKVSSTEDAQDLTSEVFLKVWQYINEKNIIKNLNALIYQIARNLVIDYYRKKAKSSINAEETLLKNITDTKSEDMQKQVHTLIEMQGLEPLLRKLKDEYREVIVLRYIEEYSLKEIASILDKQTGNVKVLLHRAVKRLKEMCEAEGKRK